MLHYRLIHTFLAVITSSTSICGAVAILDKESIQERQDPSPDSLEGPLFYSCPVYGLGQEPSPDPYETGRWYMTESDRCAMECTPQNPHLWSKRRGCDFSPEIDPQDVIQTVGAPKNWMYGARLSALGAWSKMAHEDLVKMFDPLDWCLFHGGGNLTIRANKAGVLPYNVGGQAYKDLVTKVLSTSLPTSKPPKHWAYVLGTAMRQWHPYDEGREEDVELEDLEEHAIAYLSLLTGEECAATGDITDQGQQDLAKKIIGKADSTPVIVILPNSHVDYQGVFPVSSSDEANKKYAIWDYREGIYKVIDFSYRIPMKVIYIKGAEGDDENGSWNKYPKGPQRDAECGVVDA